jgi:hypothetical protein
MPYLVPPPEPAVVVSTPSPQAIAPKQTQLIQSQAHPAITYSVSGADRSLSQQTERDITKALSQIGAVEGLSELRGIPAIVQQPLAGSQVEDSDSSPLAPTLLLQPIQPAAPPTPAPAAPFTPSPTPTPTNATAPKVLELKADRQEYDQ